jgi:MFS family permease
MPVTVDFLLSSLFAFVGGHMVNYTLILYLQERVGSDVLAGVGFGLCFGSSIIFGWFAGVLADRLHPARLIHLAHVLFVVCLCGMLWAEIGADDAQRVTAIMLSAFCGGLGWSVFGSARMATLGQITPPEKLRPITILFNLQVMIGFGLAPLVIGTVRSHGGWPQVMLTAIGFYVVSSLLLLRVRSKPRAADVETRPVLQEIADGFATVGANRLLMQLMFAAMIGFAVTGPLQILLPKLAREVLGLSEMERGAFLGLFAVALILGGIIALPLGKHVHHGKTIFGGMFLVGLVFAALSQATSVVTACAGLLLIGICAGTAISFIVAGVQAQAPAAMRGRVMSMYSIISQVIPAASGVVAGIVVKAQGVSIAILSAGLTLALLAITAAVLMPILRRQAH